MADLNQMLYRVVQHATEPPEEPSPAQVSGRKGGLKDGKTRAGKLSPEKRSEIAKKAARARWRRTKTP
jgi:hypothetical protein